MLVQCSRQQISRAPRLGGPLNSSKAGTKCSFFVLSAQSLESSVLSDWLIKFTIAVLRNLVEISHDKRTKYEEDGFYRRKYLYSSGNVQRCGGSLIMRNTFVLWFKKNKLNQSSLIAVIKLHLSTIYQVNPDTRHKQALEAHREHTKSKTQANYFNPLYTIPYLEWYVRSQKNILIGYRKAGVCQGP